MLRRENPRFHFRRQELLGIGSFGKVYKGQAIQNAVSDGGFSEDVAIKVIKICDDSFSDLEKELHFLAALRSPFVVNLLDTFLYEDHCWIVMEFCSLGSLSDVTDACQDHLTEEQIKASVAYTVSGLHHIHSKMSIHRDIKAGNILLTQGGRIKLSDFGVSAQLSESLEGRKTVIGTPYWMAPEIIQEIGYDFKVDIWSLGITIIELCEGRPPHFQVNPMRAIFMISSKPAPVIKNPEIWSSAMVNFLEYCLQKDASKRSSALQLLSHPWIMDVIAEIDRLGSHSMQGLPVLQELAATVKPCLEEKRKLSKTASFGRLSTVFENDQPHTDKMKCSPLVASGEHMLGSGYVESIGSDDTWSSQLFLSKETAGKGMNWTLQEGRSFISEGEIATPIAGIAQQDTNSSAQLTPSYGRHFSAGSDIHMNSPVSQPMPMSPRVPERNIPESPSARSVDGMNDSLVSRYCSPQARSSLMGTNSAIDLELAGIARCNRAHEVVTGVRSADNKVRPLESTEAKSWMGDGSGLDKLLEECVHNDVALYGEHAASTPVVTSGESIGEFKPRDIMALSDAENHQQEFFGQLPVSSLNSTSTSTSSYVSTLGRSFIMLEASEGVTAKDVNENSEFTTSVSPRGIGRQMEVNSMERLEQVKLNMAAALKSFRDVFAEPSSSSILSSDSSPDYEPTTHTTSVTVSAAQLSTSTHPKGQAGDSPVLLPLLVPRQQLISCLPSDEGGPVLFTGNAVSASIDDPPLPSSSSSGMHKGGKVATASSLSGLPPLNMSKQQNLDSRIPSPLFQTPPISWSSTCGDSTSGTVPSSGRDAGETIIGTVDDSANAVDALQQLESLERQYQLDMERLQKDFMGKRQELLSKAYNFVP